MPNTIIYLFISNLLVAIFCHLSAAPFPLSDTDPNSSEYKKRFKGSYGINEAIEPHLTQSDRPLYERILPYINDKPQGAIEILIKEINSDSNCAFDFLLGNLYYQVDDLKQAESWLEKAIKKFPSFRRAYRTLALIQVRNEEFEACIPNLLKVITLGGGDDQSYGLLAYAHLDQEHYKSALSAYEMARMFNPKSEDLKRGEAQCLLMTQEFSQAIALFDELISDSPDKKDYWLFQANAYIAQNEITKAISNLEIVRNMGHADFHSLILLSKLYFNEEIYDLGLSAGVDALESGEEVKFSPAIALLDHLINNSLWDQALQYLTILKKEIPINITVAEKDRLAIAQAAIDLAKNRTKSAVISLKDILNKDPLNGRALILIASHYKKEKDYEESIFYLERAIHTDDFKVQAYLAIGEIEVIRKNYAKALQTLKLAQGISFSPNVKLYMDQIRSLYTASL